MTNKLLGKKEHGFEIILIKIIINIQHKHHTHKTLYYNENLLNSQTAWYEKGGTDGH